MLGWGWRAGGEDWAVVGVRRRVAQRKNPRGLGRCMVRTAAGLEVPVIRRFSNWKVGCLEKRSAHRAFISWP